MEKSPPQLRATLPLGAINYSERQTETKEAADHITKGNTVYCVEVDEL